MPHYAVVVESAIKASASYRDARKGFVAAADRAGAHRFSVAAPEVGLHGESLAMDIARVGPGDTDAALVVMSGTHGVEGYAGSAVQTHWLSTVARSATAPVAVFFVHALNPYGFSWGRRVNECNVDLNRHFIDWDAPRPVNGGYAAIADALVPPTWDAASQDETGQRLMAHLGQVGVAQFHRDVAGGQYQYPDGLFFGGHRPGWAHAALAHLCDATLSKYRRLVCVDLHTGLGTRGQAQAILMQPPSHPGRERARALFGNALELMDDASAESDVEGPWTARVADWLPQAEVTAVALEWGTVDSLSVLDAVRADAWLHAHGEVLGPRGEAIREQMRAAFLVDEPDWWQSVWESFSLAMGVALEHLHPSR